MNKLPTKNKKWKPSALRIRIPRGLKLLLLVPFFIVVFSVDVSTTQEACAAPGDNGVPIYFKEPDKCRRAAGYSNCPPNMTDIEKGREGNLYTCRNRERNLFCRMMTGSERVEVTNEGNAEQQDYYCAAPPSSAYGTCSSNEREFAPSGDNEYYKDHSGKHSQFSLIDIPRELKLALSTVETGFGVVRPISDYQRYFKCKKFDPEAEDLDEKRYLKVPTFYLGHHKTSGDQVTRDFRFDGDPPSGNRFDVNVNGYDAASLNRMGVASNWGFILKRDIGGVDISYCKDPRHVLFNANGVGNFDCYEIDRVGDFDSCTIDLEGSPDLGAGPVAGEVCIVGLNRTALDPFVYHLETRIPRDTNLLANAQVVAKDSPLCKSNSLDLYADLSHKGCSAFYEVDQSINKVVWRRDTPKNTLSDCYKCLYGETNFKDIPVERLVDRENIMSPMVTAANLAASNTQITPNNEVFLLPIQGRIYSDIGCIGANNTSDFVNTVVRFALGILGILVILRIMQGALRLRAGDPESVAEGREVIVAAIVALLILIFSAAIINFLGINLLNLNDEGFTPLG